MGMTATIVKKALGDAHALLSEEENGNNIMEARSASAMIQQQVEVRLVIELSCLSIIMQV